jgi:hypothetical protein
LEGDLKRRFRLGLAALLLVVAFGVFAAAASAQGENSGLPAGPLSPTAEGVNAYGPNYKAFLPQETNIASLAWRGEELRFVKCSDTIPANGRFETSGVPGSFAPNTINFFVEDFSGDPHFQPHAVVGTFSYTQSHNGVQCVRGSFLSNKAGLAHIKLIVTDDNGFKVLEHQFLAGWMAIGPSSLSPTGTVTEPAGTEPGNEVQILVSGTIPLDAEWQADWGLPAQLTMPTDWPLLASKIASISRFQRLANPGIAPWRYWDIHDSSGPPTRGGDGGLPDIHVPGFCPPPNNTSTTIDQVDNCTGGGILGPFSRVFGDGTIGPVFAPGSVLGTIGPFDPQYPESTLLSDGNLNQLDAPMPPLRLEVSSNGNTGAFGFSADSSAFKANWYSRNGTGRSDSPPVAHNLYAPFYAAFIPATSRNTLDNFFFNTNYGDASGTEGPEWTYFPNGLPSSAGNNFEGYVPFLGLYEFWSFADVLVEGSDQATDCLLRTNGEGQPIFRRTNSGPQVVVVYTDEHGEARVEWLPGVNNDIFGELPVDENGACDIEGLDLGGATITAQARYPFQNVAGPVDVAGSVTKVVENLFNKSISCRLKSNQNPAGTAGILYICTASAQDIDGSGTVFNGETVCISREPVGTLYPFPRNGATGSQGELCITLSGGDADSPATGSIETPATLVGSQVDVSAFFLDENIIRDTCITVGQTPSTPGPCGSVTIPPPVNGGGGNGGSTQTPGVSVVSPQNSTTSLQGATQTVVTGHSSAALKASVVSVKVVKVRNGRALVVKVQSPNKTATVRIVLVGKHGKVLVRTVRTIQANKSVRIQRLLVPKAVKAVRVNVLR